MTESSSAPGSAPRDAATAELEALVRHLAAATGLFMRNEEVPAVAQAYREYLAHAVTLSSVDVVLGDGAALGLDVARWLAPPSSSQ